MNKIPCARCGVLILPTTAQTNEGLCIPCKRGNREAIENQRKWAQEQRERQVNDPMAKLWKELVHRVHETEEGFSFLSPTEKEYFAVCLLDGELYNGGFDQYFYNSSGSYYKYAVSGLEKMGASHALELLRRAKQVLFDFSDCPESTEQRRHVLRKNSSASRDKRLSQLDSEFNKVAESLGELIKNFAVEHKLI